MFYSEIGVGKETVIVQLHRKVAEEMLQRADEEKIDTDFYVVLRARLKRPGDLITLNAAYHDVGIEF